MARPIRIPATPRQVLLGFLIAPGLGAAVYMLVIGWAYWCGRVIGGGYDDAATALGGLLSGSLGAVILGPLFGAVVAYPAMFCIGVPIWILLHRARAEAGRNYALLGALGGAVIPKSLSGFEPALLHNAIAGTAVMSIFWYILATGSWLPTREDSAPHAE